MRHDPRGRRYVRGVAWLFIIGASVWVLSMAGPVLMVKRPLSPVDALLVLGSHEWERLPMTARLAAVETEAVVLLTQPRRPTVSNCHLCSERVNWLEQLGTPAERVELLSRRVTNTYDEALAARQYSLNHPLRRLLVVTSPYHARRALAVFRTVFEGTAVSVGVSFDESVAAPEGWWRRPYDRAYVAYEWAALAWYAVRHGVNPLVRDEPGATVQVTAL